MPVRTSKRRITWQGLVIFALAAVVVAGASLLLPGSKQENTVATVYCEENAVRQLPADLVAQVNAIQRRRKVPTEDGGGLTLAVRRVDDHFITAAFTYFNPKYCGYGGNIEYRSTDGTPFSNAQLNKGVFDQIEMRRHGVQYLNWASDPKICISNQPRTAEVVKGVIVMILQCDRLYDDDGKPGYPPSPKLVEVP